MKLCQFFSINVELKMKFELYCTLNYTQLKVLIYTYFVIIERVKITRFQLFDLAQHLAFE